MNAIVLLDDNNNVRSVVNPAPFSTGILLQTATVTLTNAQILTLPSVPIRIVPAPGVGRGLILISGIIVMNNLAGAYVIDPNSSIQIIHGTISGASAPSFPQFETPGKWLSQLLPIGDVGTGDFTNTLISLSIDVGAKIDNQPLNIADVFDGVPNYTGGNSLNTMKVIVYYLAVDVS